MVDSQVRSIRDIIYQVVDGVECMLDLHIPDDGPRRPGVVVYLHGGGLEEGARTDYEDTRAIALARDGFTVATVQYRFLQQVPLPGSIDDCRAAIAWIKANGDEHGYDPAFVGAWGASAGGYLAALLATGNPEGGLGPDVDCAVVWFAAFDLEAMGALSPMEKALFGGSPTDGMLGGTFDGRDSRHRALNPIGLVSSSSSPMLLVTGDRDKVIEAAQSTRMHDALVRAGAQSTLVLVGGAGHESPDFETQWSRGFTAAFFAEHFRSK